MLTLPEDVGQTRSDRPALIAGTGGVERETLTEKVETAMRLDILRGVFLPGSRIRGSEAKRYGVSPTPFREALQRLASDGLVEIDPQSGARVARVSREDLEDVFALRRLLEREALCRAIGNAKDDSGWAADLSLSIDRYRESIRALRTDLDDLGLVESWSAAHDRFMEILYAGCGSERLQHLILAFVRHARRYRAIAIRLLESRTFDAAQIDLLLAEVEALYRAAMNHDTEEALAALEGHLTRTEAYLARLLSALGDAEKVGRELPESN